MNKSEMHFMAFLTGSSPENVIKSLTWHIIVVLSTLGFSISPSNVLIIKVYVNFSFLLAFLSCFDLWQVRRWVKLCDLPLEFHYELKGKTGAEQTRAAFNLWLCCHSERVVKPSRSKLQLALWQTDVEIIGREEERETWRRCTEAVSLL